MFCADEIGGAAVFGFRLNCTVSAQIERTGRSPVLRSTTY